MLLRNFVQGKSCSVKRENQLTTFSFSLPHPPSTQSSAIVAPEPVPAPTNVNSAPAVVAPLPADAIKDLIGNACGDHLTFARCRTYEICVKQGRNFLCRPWFQGQCSETSPHYNIIHTKKKCNGQAGDPCQKQDCSKSVLVHHILPSCISLIGPGRTGCNKVECKHGHDHPDIRLAVYAQRKVEADLNAARDQSRSFR